MEEMVCYVEDQFHQHSLGSACLHEGQGFFLDVTFALDLQCVHWLVYYCVLQRTNGVLPTGQEAMWSKYKPCKLHKERTRPTSPASQNWSSLADRYDDKESRMYLEAVLPKEEGWHQRNQDSLCLSFKLSSFQRLSYPLKRRNDYKMLIMAYNFII